MKLEKDVIAGACLFIGFVVGVIYVNITDKETGAVDIKQEISEYDPNDPMYNFIPMAHVSWREKYGDNERTRLIYSISEMRVAIAGINKILTRDANEPNKP
jgi:hypothetical protein